MASVVVTAISAAAAAQHANLDELVAQSTFFETQAWPIIEAECLEIESLPRGDGRDSKPPVGETGRGGAEPAVAVEHEHRSRRDWRVHQREPMTGWASRIRWSNPVS